MSAAVPADDVIIEEERTLTQRILDSIERAGNKVPHPAMMFVYLIVVVIALSAVLDVLGVSVTEEIIVPAPQEVTTDNVGGSIAPVIITEETFDTDYMVIEEEVAVQSLLTVEGLRFIFTSFVSNFAGFSVVAVIFVAMLGVGVAEEAGLMGALIRKLVHVAPRQGLTFIIVLIGGLSSVATDAGYLILIPLGAAAFLSVGRHPLAGIAAAYAGVSAAFAVNILIAPIDALLTEITNEAIALADPETSITITANLIFSITFTLLMALVVTVVTERMIESRLGTFQPDPGGITAGGGGAGGDAPPDEKAVDPVSESRGLRYCLFAVLGALLVIVLLTAPPGAPLRDPETDAIIGDTPFMDSLIFLISMIFLAAGIGYGLGAKTIKSTDDVMAAITKTFAAQGGLIFILLLISQFIAYFNFSNMPRVIAGGMAHALESADVHEILLLIGMILAIMVLDIIIPGALPKWAIFAPVFVPLFMRLGVAPQTVLAAYRIGDSPMNVVTPLMVYLPFIVLVAQRYQASAGIGTIISLMIPYTLVVAAVWIVLFVLWYVLGIPVGPGYPVGT